MGRDFRGLALINIHLSMLAACVIQARVAASKTRSAVVADGTMGHIDDSARVGKPGTIWSTSIMSVVFSPLPRPPSRLDPL